MSRSSAWVGVNANSLNGTSSVRPCQWWMPPLKDAWVVPRFNHTKATTRRWVTASTIFLFKILSLLHHGPVQSPYYIYKIDYFYASKVELNGIYGELWANFLCKLIFIPNFSTEHVIVMINKPDQYTQAHLQDQTCVFRYAVKLISLP